MMIRTDMMTALIRARRHLSDSLPEVLDFLRSRQMSDGGFCGRDKESDLYYTVFGVEALTTLEGQFNRPSLREYLKQFGDGEDLDLVHASALVRCWANSLGVNWEPDLRDALIKRILSFRTCEGGFGQLPGDEKGSCYGAFLAIGALQDLDGPIDQPDQILHSVLSLQKENGSFSNDVHITAGSSPATAAAIAVLYYLDHPVPDKSIEWLLRRCRAVGGFTVMELSPIPDLLSTAVSLHSLGLINADIDTIRQPCLEFVDSLWNIEGGFTANWMEDDLDCEYTYYGLLALGNL